MSKYQEAFIRVDINPSPKHKSAEEFLKDYDTIEKGLQALEDIEDILGMDLASAVKLCNRANEQHYIYVQEDWGLYKLEFISDLDIQLLNHCLYTNHRGIWFSFDLQEYKITWWLKENKSE